MGKVIFVAAGCGDPDLIAVKGTRYLQQADVVLTDRLVSHAILQQYVSPAATLLYVGKQCRNSASTPQESINDLMVQHALAGKLVVRLKGGDVSIFSNILDELQVLVNNNIAYEIVPGVTAALGAAAYAGIPLTARNYATAVRFITAHQTDTLTNKYWKELAATDDTLVFYMSSETLPHVVAQLIANNIASDKLLAVVEQASTPFQQVYISNLYEYQNELKQQSFISPSLVIIGRVVALHKQFAWFSGSQQKASYFIGLPFRNTTTEEKSINKITIAYATETGNSKKLATDFASKAKKKGIQTKLVNLEQYRLNDLIKEEYFFTIISTHGEGEPPDAARKFYDYIHKSDLKLDKLKYSVLALGDTAYPLFCKAGEDVDLQLNSLGGERVCKIQKCDVDYEQDAFVWVDSILQSLGTTNGKTIVPAPAIITTPKSSKRKQYKGTILSTIDLNDHGSNKQTFHIELGAEQLVYEPGDCIGIVPPVAEGTAPIAPRLYSISSSLQAHENEVHITVVKNKYAVDGEEKIGLCSGFLSQLKEHDELEFYIHKNNSFRLPSPEKDIIMIGPGTGIAPFRSFLFEREATGATGRNWLFFGEQHFQTDFLYQTELLSWFDTGLLTKLSVAFSRDQEEKIYVQHRMLQYGKELYEWLEAGAHLYVCGTKDPMSIDVERALHTIVEIFGSKSSEAAQKYVERLKEDDRYLKDVY